MFGLDRYHPSAEGYRMAAFAVLPTALTALGLRVEGLPSQPTSNAAQKADNAVPSKRDRAGASTGDGAVVSTRR